MSKASIAMADAANLMKKCNGLIKDLGELNREYVAENERLKKALENIQDNCETIIECMVEDSDLAWHQPVGLNIEYCKEALEGGES